MVHAHHRGGTGPGLPLLLVHGWSCDHRAMLPVAEAFPERAAILPDLPGHGRNPAPADLSIPAHASALLAVAPARFIAVGHSMGGQVALAMAAAAPDRVAGAVLLDPAHILASDKAMEVGEALAEKLDRFPPAEVVEAFARGMLTGPLPAAMAGRFDALVATMAQTPADIVRAQWRAILAWNGAGGGAAALAALKVPVLVIGCDRPVNRLADLGRASRHVATAQLACTGHMVQFEAMEQVEAMIRHWLRCTSLG